MIERYRLALPWLVVALLVWVVPTSPCSAQGGYAGDDTCADCHDDVAEEIAATVHAEVPERWEGEGGTCESCHGPGSRHVDAENGDIDATDAQLKAYQQEMVLKLKDAEDLCKRCHDLDNSPDFHKEGAFEDYWKKVEHYGKD